MSSHQQQHAEGQQEQIQEECLSVHAFIQLHNAHSLVENCLQEGITILEENKNNSMQIPITNNKLQISDGESSNNYSRHGILLN